MITIICTHHTCTFHRTPSDFLSAHCSCRQDDAETTVDFAGSNWLYNPTHESSPSEVDRHLQILCEGADPDGINSLCTLSPSLLRPWPSRGLSLRLQRLTLF